jgi:hypothetical protein
LTAAAILPSIILLRAERRARARKGEAALAGPEELAEAIAA